MQLPLTEPQERLVFSEAPHPAMVAGLGCVHKDTKVWTEYGLMRIADIDRPIRVLSWDEKDQKFRLSLSGGSFPKGRATLYRVVTRQGEFVATGHHQIFSSDCKYVPVDSLHPACGAIMRSCVDPLLTIEELSRKSSRSDDPHSSQTIADYLGSCAAEARRYGLRLHRDQDSGLNVSPEQSGAHKLSRTYALSVCEQMGGQGAQKQGRSRPGQFSGHDEKMGCVGRYAGPVAALGGLTFSLLPVRTFASLLESLRFLLMSLLRHTTERFSALAHNLNLLPAWEPPKLLPSDILQVSEVECNGEYWDMQVLETNNYVDEHGFIHHNSGKTQAGLARLVVLMVREPGVNTAYYLPTYDLIKLRAIPGAEEMLSNLGLPYSTNRSDYALTIIGYGDIIFRSYDRPERIVAYEVAHSVVDELDTLPKDKATYVWRKVSERNRQATSGVNTIANVTTPDQGYSGFTYARWEKQRPDGYELIKAETASNPFLPDGYIEQIRANYDPILADMYLKGEFVSLSQNKVYHQFDRNRHHVARTIKEGDRLHVGLDFNIGGTCATVWVIEGNGPVAVDEFVSHDTQDFLVRIKRYKGHNITIYPDATGKAARTNASLSDIGIIMQGGYNVDAPEANPPVRDRVNAINGLLAHDRMRVNTDTCPELTNALETQGYTVKGEPEKFDDHPAVDDWTDCAGYFVNRRFPVIGRHATVENMRNAS